MVQGNKSYYYSIFVPNSILVPVYAALLIRVYRGSEFAFIK